MYTRSLDKLPVSTVYRQCLSKVDALEAGDLKFVFKISNIHWPVRIFNMNLFIKVVSSELRSVYHAILPTFPSTHLRLISLALFTPTTANLASRNFFQVQPRDGSLNYNPRHCK